MVKKSEKEDFLTLLLGIYIIAIGVGLPLIVRDMYFDILIIKYYYFCFCTITMFLLFIGYGVTAGQKSLSSYMKGFSVKKLTANLTLPDYALVIYLCIAIISTMSSDYLFEAFWGNEGRYTGLFLLFWYVIAYFCISRFSKFKPIYIDLILLTGILVSVFGITDYFQMDFLGFKELMVEEEKAIFTSTLGNINTYTAYIGIIASISAVLFANCEEKKHMVYYYLCMVISFFAIIMGVSDNAYLSLAALFGFLPFILFKNKNGVKKYLIIISTFLSVIQMIAWINTAFPNTVLGIDGVFNMFITLGILPYMIFGLWLVTFIWYFSDHKQHREDLLYGRTLRYLWGGLLIAIAAVIIYAVIDCNILGHADRYGSLNNYLLFDDEWGTHRGYIWRNAMECFKGLSNWKKLVGFGPETFGILILEQTRNNPYKQTFDNAHNEYLHILVTVGIAGVSTYVFYIIALLKQGFKYAKENIYVAAMGFGIICYCAQAFVNLNLPIVAPIFWILLGMISSEINKRKKNGRTRQNIK